MSGFNFHGGPGGIYPPIAEGRSHDELGGAAQVHGLLVFSELAANHSTSPPANATSSDDLPATGDHLCQHGIAGDVLRSIVRQVWRHGLRQRPGGGTGVPRRQYQKPERPRHERRAVRDQLREPAAARGVHAVSCSSMMHNGSRYRGEGDCHSPYRTSVCIPTTRERAAPRDARCVSSPRLRFYPSGRTTSSMRGRRFSVSRDGRPSGVRDEVDRMARYGREECFDFALLATVSRSMVVHGAWDERLRIGHRNGHWVQ